MFPNKKNYAAPPSSSMKKVRLWNCWFKNVTVVILFQTHWRVLYTWV